MTLTYGSVCSGIEAATVAWHTLGWKPVFFSEIEPFPCAVLKHHYPNVPNYGDMTKHHDWPKHTIDVLVGGTPCQAFSVAGLRAGLADPRGNLSITFLSIVEQYRPKWVVWENVPGVLSDKSGAFGAFLGGLAHIGYGFAYRILDAQYFGLAQRRKRVFVVGHIGGQWQRAAAVLFESESLRGDPAPSRETGQNTPAGIEESSGIGIGGGQLGYTLRSNASHSGDKGDGGVNTTLVANPLGSRGGRPDGLGQRHIHCAEVTTVDARNKIDRGDSQHLDRLIAEK